MSAGLARFVRPGARDRSVRLALLLLAVACAGGDRVGASSARGRGGPPAPAGDAAPPLIAAATRDTPAAAAESSTGTSHRATLSDTASYLAYLSPGARALVGRYRAALADTAASGGLARLYELAVTLEPLALELDSVARDTAAFRRMRSDLRGVDLFSEDVGSSASPDLDEMARLAGAHGSDADRRFFRLMREVYPHGMLWEVWIEQRTDESGVLSLAAADSSHILPRLIAYVRAEPAGAYRRYAERAHDSLMGELLRPCYARDRERDLAALGRVAAQVAGTPEEAALRGTIRAIEAGDSATVAFEACRFG